MYFRRVPRYWKLHFWAFFPSSCFCGSSSPGRQNFSPMRTKTSAGALCFCFFQPSFNGLELSLSCQTSYRERNLFDFCVVIAGCFDVMFDFSPVRHEKAGFSNR